MRKDTAWEMVDEKSPVIAIMGVSRYRPGVLGITVSRLIKQSILSRRSFSSGLNARIWEKCIGLEKGQFPYLFLVCRKLNNVMVVQVHIKLL